MAVEPTKLTAATAGLSNSSSTASLSPLTTLRQPLGSPASPISSASRSPHDGSFSEGFRTNVLPHASAIGNIHMGAMAGKLNSVIPAQTPTGWRMAKVSTPLATPSENSPFNKCGMPQANSTTSSPRVMDPLASATVLPCSLDRISASSSMFRYSSSRKANNTCARFAGGVSDQPGRAASAAEMARFVSSLHASGARLTTSPVAGYRHHRSGRFRL